MCRARPPVEITFAEIVPHLTLADRRDPESLPDVIDDVRPQLPLRATVPALTLMRLADERWIPDAEFAFAG